MCSKSVSMDSLPDLYGQWLYIVWALRKSKSRSLDLSWYAQCFRNWIQFHQHIFRRTEIVWHILLSWATLATAGICRWTSSLPDRLQNVPNWVASVRRSHLVTEADRISNYLKTNDRGSFLQVWLPFPPHSSRLKLIHFRNFVYINYTPDSWQYPDYPDTTQFSSSYSRCRAAIRKECLWKQDYSGAVWVIVESSIYHFTGCFQ
jgi:hypothetical protein